MNIEKLEAVKQMNFVISDLFSDYHEHLINLLKDKKQAEKLNDLQIIFTRSDENYAACVYKKDDVLAVNVDSFFTTALNQIAIHELAHIITNRYIGNIGHTLEFAIIESCLYAFLSGIITGFNSYSISDDEVYKELAINVYQYTKLIEQIEWETLQELADKSKKYAEIIRAKYGRG